MVVDRTHLGRRASGIERITRELFSDEGLAPLPVSGTAPTSGRLSMMIRQTLQNPLAACLNPESVWIFSGFPPSPAFSVLAHRSVLYVHDLFLVERPADLNRAARFYMAPNFRLALKTFRYFLANSITTADSLRRHVDPGATIQLYRPPARDVLGLGSMTPAGEKARSSPLSVGMIGTIEPRKNYPAAVEICHALAARLGRPVELHIVGRPGWGGDAAVLAASPNVRLHGFVDDAAIRELIRGWDLFLSTSHDEGLGLPLMEVQHRGLPIAAPDKPVFREVLGRSGILIDTADARGAASVIAAAIEGPDRDARFAEAGRANIDRWNGLAAADRAAVVALLAQRMSAASKGRSA